MNITQRFSLKQPRCIAFSVYSVNSRALVLANLYMSKRCSTYLLPVETKTSILTFLMVGNTKEDASPCKETDNQLTQVHINIMIYFIVPPLQHNITVLVGWQNTELNKI